MVAELAAGIVKESRDTSILALPRVTEEAARLAALRSYEVLDTPADPRIDVFVRVAAQFYDVPISMVSLVDEDRTWFKASHGIDVPEVPNESSFCAHAVGQPAVTVIEDTRSDPRFADNALVTGPDGFRFYAGAPIRTAEGHALGTLCILDHKSRTLDERGRQRLADLATGVGAVLDLHRNAVRLRRAATHDPLTGLANRALFEPMLADAVEGATHRSPVAVICIDLDHFKQVNDQFGHSGGDTMLRVVADRLRACVRPTDLPARLGGDEFAVLLAGPLDPGAPRTVAERMLAALAEPVRIGDVEVPIMASAGYALAPVHAMDGPTLVRVADTALYTAKSAGRGASAGPEQFDPARGPSLLDDLRVAIADGGLELAWQPYFDLRTRELRGREALVRWTRKGHGPVPPQLFVKLAEENGLADALEDWVLQAACLAGMAETRALAGSAETGGGVAVAELGGLATDGLRVGTEVSVNVTATCLLAPGFARRVAAVLQSTELPPSRLVLEVDERTACANRILMRERVLEMAAMGVTLALHNFGTGDASLACLRDVPFGRIKLGRSLVQAIGIDPRTASLARSLVQMCVALGSVVCAEGVETSEQLTAMQDAGCELGQGYLLGAPTFDPLPTDV